MIFYDYRKIQYHRFFLKKNMRNNFAFLAVIYFAQQLDSLNYLCTNLPYVRSSLSTR